MSDTLEHAREGIEHAHHAAHDPHTDPFARRCAVLIAALAALLAIFEMGENGAQNEYLTHHISLSDNWAFYQAKLLRSNLYGVEADLLQALPNSDPARVAAARQTSQRLADDDATQGARQLRANAAALTATRDHAYHRYHALEIVCGALQIAVVLASVSVVTRLPLLALGTGVIGAVAALGGLAVLTGII
jgi:hypothetical protein